MRLLCTGTLLEGNHLNKVWRGMAQRANSLEPGLPMMVKWVAKKEVLAAELACAVAARALRLPVPGGALVMAEKADLPGLPQRVRGGPKDMVLCFGSELQWPDDTMARPRAADDAEEWVWQQVCHSSQGASGGVWDELVANEDRHCQNLVFDGARWWLIDHERALPSVAKVMEKFAQAIARQAVIEERARQNILASEMLARRPMDHKMEALPAAWTGQRQRLQWLVEQSRDWAVGVPDVDTVLMMAHVYLSSIALRLPTLALHLKHRLAQPDAASLWNSSSPTTAKTPRRTRSPRPRS